MRQSHLRHTPTTLTLGGACLLGLGFAGCSRDNGLDLAKQDARTNSVVTERANESILRSKQELAGVTGDGKSSPNGLAESDTHVDERPALASRWKSPFKGVSNLLKKKTDDTGEDPFLAQSKADVKAAGKEPVAGGQAPEKAVATKSPAAATGEKKVALADAPLKTAAGTTKSLPKSVVASDSRTALDEFLKSQEPIGLDDSDLIAGYGSDDSSRKPGTTSRTKKPAGEAFATAGPHEDAATALEHRTPQSRTVAAAGKARPFPADSIDAGTSTARPTSKLRQNVVTEPAPKNSVAAAGSKRVNPLLDDAEVAPATSRTKQATGREIAALLKKAKAAGDQGELEEALSCAVQASDLAQQCSYEFVSTEQSPEKMLAWLADKQARAEQLARARDDRRQLLAARPRRSTVGATPTAFAKPSAEQIFSDAAKTEEVEKEVEEPAAEPAVAAATSRKIPVAASPFNEWANGVGRENVSEGRSPSWPVLSSVELAASDNLWKPSRSGFEQTWTELTRQTGAASQHSDAETQLASAESNAPAFVATAEARGAASTRVVTSGDPVVQLGQPTDLAPGPDGYLLAHNDRSVEHRRGPRLATPPPLSIDDAGHDVAKSTVRGTSLSRTIWFSLIGGLALVVLAIFRRWAYQAPAEATS